MTRSRRRLDAAPLETVLQGSAFVRVREARRERQRARFRLSTLIVINGISIAVIVVSVVLLVRL